MITSVHKQTGAAGATRQVVVTLPLQTTIDAEIEQSAARRPDKVALRVRRDGHWFELTYGELVANARLGAARLASLGVEPGDRIGLLSENRPEWMQSYLAIVGCRATAVPLDPLLPARDLQKMLETCNARALIASAATLPAELAEWLRSAGIPALDVAAGLPSHPGAAASCPPYPAAAPDDRDPAVASIIFSSGTTGNPKGVVLTHANLLADAWLGSHAAEYSAEDELLSVLPLFHVFEFNGGNVLPLLTGATITYAEALRGDVILQAMQETGTTVMLVVPRLLELFYTGIQRQVQERGALARAAFGLLGAATRAGRMLGFDPAPRLFRRIHQRFGGRLRFFICGAAALAPSTWLGLEGFGFRVRQGYGLSETSPVLTLHRAGDRRCGTVGQPLDGVELRVFHPDSQGEGEILVRGAMVTPGYFRDPQSTRAALRDGWLHTGDIGRVDRDGHVVLTGRIKELIVTAAGKNVHPVDVERRYGVLPGFLELCVFGVRGRGLGEEVHAAAVLDPSVYPSDQDEAERQQRAEAELARRAEAAELPSYMRIQRLHVVDEIPKTTTLKVKRHELARLVSRPRGTRRGTGPLAARATAPLDQADLLIAQLLLLIRQTFPDRAEAVSPEATLQFDLGLDSLELVELLAAAEQRFGVSFGAEQPAGLSRVQDLAHAIAACKVAPAEPCQASPAAPLPPKRGGAALGFLQGFRNLVRSLYRLEVSGLEHLPPGPVILCPNHESHVDVFLVASQLPAELQRQLVCFAKREHFAAAGTRLMANLASAIPVDRDGDVRQALGQGRRALAAGRSLLIHPEGTRTKNGNLCEFRAGAALLAAEAGVPLVPVRIRGAFAIYPESRKLPRLLDWRRLRRLPLQIAFGPPIYPGTDAADHKHAEELTRQLRAAVEAL